MESVPRLMRAAREGIAHPANPAARPPKTAPRRRPQRGRPPCPPPFHAIAAWRWRRRSPRSRDPGPSGRSRRQPSHRPCCRWWSGLGRRPPPPSGAGTSGSGAAASCGRRRGDRASSAVLGPRAGGRRRFRPGRATRKAADRTAEPVRQSLETRGGHGKGGHRGRAAGPGRGAGTPQPRGLSPSVRGRGSRGRSPCPVPAC